VILILILINVVLQYNFLNFILAGLPILFDRVSALRLWALLPLGLKEGGHCQEEPTLGTQTNDTIQIIVQHLLLCLNRLALLFNYIV
jgi:hypothetical protein